MLPRELSSNEPSLHLLKVRRVSTYNHPSHTQSSLQQSFAQDSPYFREMTEYKSELLPKRGNFISSLITKLKNVERPQRSSFSSRECMLMRADPQGSVQNLQKVSKLMISKKLSNEPQFFDKKPPNSNPQTLTKIDKNNLEQLELQNFILKEKVHELIMENEKLKLRFNKIAKDLKEMEDQFVKREEELNKLQSELILKQRLFDPQTAKFIQIPKDTQEDELFLSLSEVMISEPTKLSLCRQMNEVIFPTESVQLVKATQEIKQLRLEKLELQKKFTSSLSQYRKKKQDQIEKIKRGFTSNLAHYKDLLLKVSFKPPLETKKYQEDTFQTVILQTSSADQS